MRKDAIFSGALGTFALCPFVWFGKRQHISSVGPCFSWLGVPGWATTCFHAHVRKRHDPNAIFLFLHHLHGGVILFGFRHTP